MLLAEASSGKSEEFRNQARQLVRVGRPAFYLRIEELADQGFEAALSPQETIAFNGWRSGTHEGHFFIDPVDESRLSRRSFDAALKRFAREIGEGLPRAHVYISCRVTDWRNESDRSVVERTLPAWERVRAADISVEADPLLDPIFRDSKTTLAAEHHEAKEHELMVVQIAALDAGQRRLLATAADVTDIEGFTTAQQSGLEAFAERPGDLIALAIHWNDHGRFDKLAVMIEGAIRNKLREIDCTSAECIALLRRGFFAPSTFGRIRFHHRSTREYLAAKSFERRRRSEGATCGGLSQARSAPPWHSGHKQPPP